MQKCFGVLFAYNLNYPHAGHETIFCKDGRVQLQHIFWHVVLILKLLLKGTEPQDGLELNFVDMHGYFKAQRRPAASLYIPF